MSISDLRFAYSSESDWYSAFWCLGNDTFCSVMSAWCFWLNASEIGRKLTVEHGRKRTVEHFLGPEFRARKEADRRTRPSNTVVRLVVRLQAAHKQPHQTIRTDPRSHKQGT